MNYFLSFAISLISLVIAADFLVKFTERFSAKAKLSPLVLGATVIACGTSIPELSVALSSINQGVAALSFGDIIGSNIGNVSLILGIGIIFFPVRIGTEKTQRNNIILIFLTFSFILLLFSPANTQKSLALFLSLFYLVFLFLEFFWGAIGSQHEDKLALKNSPGRATSFWRSLAGIAGCLAALAVSSKFLVSSAISIANYLKVENHIVGLTIVAIGTSLPELLTTIVSGLRHDWKLLLGSIQGSNIFNLSVIGTILILFGGNGIAGQAFHLSLGYLSITAVVLFLLTSYFIGKSIPRAFGLIFLLIYTSYVFLIFR